MTASDDSWIALVNNFLKPWGSVKQVYSIKRHYTNLVYMEE